MYLIIVLKLQYFNVLFLSQTMSLMTNVSVPALRARSILPSDIVEYLDRAFTQKGLREHIRGRKKRNYPKRSAIIKANPVTGELIYPAESPEKVNPF